MPRSVVSRLVAAALLPLACLAPRASAQDAAVVNPHTIKVKLDNERVRVLEATLAPGVKEALHSHPASVVHVIVGGRVRNHAADGSTSESELVAGDTLYRDPLTHWAENVGTTTIRLIVVELEDPQ